MSLHSTGKKGKIWATHLPATAKIFTRYEGNEIIVKVKDVGQAEPKWKSFTEDKMAKKHRERQKARDEALLKKMKQKEDERGRVIYTKYLTAEKLSTTVAKDLWLYMEFIDSSGTVVEMSNMKLVHEAINMLNENGSEIYANEYGVYDGYNVCDGYELSGEETADLEMTGPGNFDLEVVKWAQELDGKEITCGSVFNTKIYTLRTGIIKEPGTGTSREFEDD